MKTSIAKDMLMGGNLICILQQHKLLKAGRTPLKSDETFHKLNQENFGNHQERHWSNIMGVSKEYIKRDKIRMMEQKNVKNTLKMCIKQLGIAQ